MESWHPAFVHFPIVLLPLSVVLDVVAWRKERPDWHGLSYALLVLGTVAAVAAMVSGNQAALAYRELAINSKIEDHENLSTVVLLLFLAIVLGRLPLHLQRQLRDWRLRGWVLLAGLGSALLWVSAYWGGQLVYVYGVGVQRSGQIP